MAIFLGLDPSIAAFGFGVLELVGTERRVLELGTVRTKAEDGLDTRLARIGAELGRVVRDHHCQVAGIEELRFVAAGEHGGRVNADNSQSFLAAGVAFATCQAYGCAARFVNPQRAKVAVLGPGQGHARTRPTNPREVHAQKMARKRGVRERLEQLLGVELTCSLDASDALSFAWLLTLEYRPVLRCPVPHNPVEPTAIGHTASGATVYGIRKRGGRHVGKGGMGTPSPDKEAASPADSSKNSSSDETESLG